MSPPLKFRHRIGLLVSLAAIALVVVTVVALVLGRRSEQQLTGIETQYVPLLELDRDLKRLAADLVKALEDAAGAADEAKLDDAATLKIAFVRRLEAARDTIIGNGAADPDRLRAVLDTYYTSAHGLARGIIQGTPFPHLASEIETMRRARDDLLRTLDIATSPDRTRLATALDTARESQNESLAIDIIVACGVLALMALLSWRIIRRTVRSLQAVSDGVERLARGDFGTAIDLPPGDEIGDLAQEANKTAARLREYREEADRALRETQRQAQAVEAANQELEAFSYSVSHDLRAPLRGIDGFSRALAEDEAEKMSPKGREYLARMRASAQRMSELIDDLLRLSRVNRGELKRESIDVSAMARLVVDELRKVAPERTVDVVIQDGVRVSGDARLVRITLENLLGNAWKFTSKRDGACIEVGARREGDDQVITVRDNGAGFDMKYAERLFGAFQRLHADKDFPGTGIGLATVKRIVQRHGGRIWVEAEPNVGATFLFTLPDPA